MSKLLLLSIFIATTKLFAQNSEKDVPKIYPSQFVTIIEKSSVNFKKKKVNDTLFARYPTKQMRYFVDNDSEIDIIFDQDSLARSNDFTGNISVIAQLNDRDIEVSSYSSIGKNLEKRGIDGVVSPQEFSISIIGMIKEGIEMLDLIENPEKLNGSRGSYNRNITSKSFIADNEGLSSELFSTRLSIEQDSREFTIESKALTKILEELQAIKRDTVRNTENEAISFEAIINKYSAVYGTYIFVPEAFDRETDTDVFILYIQDLLDAANKRIQTFEEQKGYFSNDPTDVNRGGDSATKTKFINEKASNEFKKRFRLYSALKTKLNLFANYINTNLSLTNAEASQAFSQTMKRDPIFVKYISNELGLFSSEFDEAIDKVDYETLGLYYGNEVNLSLDKLIQIDSELLSASYRLYLILKQFQEIGKQFILPTIEENNSLKTELGLIYQKISSNSQIFEVEKESVSDSFRTAISKDNINQTLLDVLADIKMREYLIEKLTDEASAFIYKKLVPGTINLTLQGAKEGDRLVIKLLWYNYNGASDNEEGKAMPQVIPLGVYTVRELGWTKSVSESFLFVDDLKTDSLSNFKPAVGASLIWKYGSTKKGDFRLDPSAGFNLSFVDFDPDREIELGFGVIGGVFSNSILVNFGYNLHVDKLYWSVGFSFTNLAKRFGFE